MSLSKIFSFQEILSVLYSYCIYVDFSLKVSKLVQIVHNFNTVLGINKISRNLISRLSGTHKNREINLFSKFFYLTVLYITLYKYIFINLYTRMHIYGYIVDVQKRRQITRSIQLCNTSLPHTHWIADCCVFD